MNWNAEKNSIWALFWHHLWHGICESIICCICEMIKVMKGLCIMIIYMVSHYNIYRWIIGYRWACRQSNIVCHPLQYLLAVELFANQLLCTDCQGNYWNYWYWVSSIICGWAFHKTNIVPNPESSKYLVCCLLGNQPLSFSEYKHCCWSKNSVCCLLGNQPLSFSEDKYWCRRIQACQSQYMGPYIVMAGYIFAVHGNIKRGRLY